MKYRVANKGRLGAEVGFSFDGRSLTGRRGDTLASALLANGVHLVGRSFKYHRPRGILSAGSEEPNALVSIKRPGGRSDPNTRATVQELFEGLVADSQHRWPSLAVDLNALTSIASPFVAAGFYYKTFMWPRSFWTRFYEPVIRAAAGLGEAPTDPDPDTYAHLYEHCDVLVIGGGIAGIAAAMSAGASGAKTILVDEQAEIGGTLLSDPSVEIDGASCWQWLEKAHDELGEMDNVLVLSRTTAIGYYHQNMVVMAQRLTDHRDGPPPKALPRERLWHVRAKQVVLAQGAIERPLVFSGNDRPGVMLADASRTYLNRYGVLVGARPLVVTNNDTAWNAAFDLAEAGADIAAIVDERFEVHPDLKGRARTLNINVLTGHHVAKTEGRLRIVAAIVHSDQGAAKQRIVCDAVLMSGGWTPSVHLFSHTRGSLNWNPDEQSFLPGDTIERCRPVGAGNGTTTFQGAATEGATAGAAAAEDAGFKSTERAIKVRSTSELDQPLTVLAHSAVPEGAKAFIDFQNDVTTRDIKQAVREGFTSIEHVKRYTTTGMATDQGKTSNINGLKVAAASIGKPAPDIGLTTFRPPYTPTTFGALAGHHKGATFDIERRTPIDAWAEAEGAVYEPVGQWRRARYFPQGQEDMHQAVARECMAVRNSLGMFDASTLGKIEIVGPDAAEFMNRMYTNPWTKLTPGRCRYGLMLSEDGFIYDDGVIGRLGPDRFHVTTTTGGAPRVLNMMEDYLQTEWSDLSVWLTSVTEQWAVIALAGPRSRDLIKPMIDDVDLSDEAFPHMSIATGHILSIPMRLFRVSFSGERGYEINVPARYGLGLWKHLFAEGQRYDITPYGTETMHVLRAEKGFIIVGQDTDGTVTPDDAGLNWAIGKKKPDFVGKRSLTRPDMSKPDRKHLVGLLTTDSNEVLPEGAQIVADPDQQIPMDMIGHVTSSYWSAPSGRSIAMALVAGGRNRFGETVYIPLEGKTVPATVTATTFFDPDNKRINA